jgi:amino acid adenylation domain-containing protein
MKNIQERIPISQLSTNCEMVISKVIPSTPSQMEMWLQCHLGGKQASMAYNESNSFRLHGYLEVDFLEKAFQFVISRHEGMRAIFCPDGKQIVIFAKNHSTIKVTDITDLAELEKEEFLQKHSKDTGFYEFDFTKGPLYILELIKINELEHMVTFTGHHLIFDGWSMSLLAEELSLAYGQLCKGKELDLPEVQTLSDYVMRNLHFSESIDKNVKLDFWIKNLSNPVPQLELPIDFERPSIRNLKAASIEYKAPRGLMVKAKRYAASRNVSLNVLLLSVYELFLSHWVKDSDIILGMPRAGQPLLRCSRMIGHSVHLLPIRAKVDLNLTFEEYLSQRRDCFVGVLSNGMISFGELIQSLQIKRDPSRIPLIPLTFNIQIGLDAKIHFSDLNHKFISNPKAYSNFEIILNLFGSLMNTTFEWTYNQSLFKESTIYDAARMYSLLIERILDSPNERLVFINSIISPVDNVEISEQSDLNGYKISQTPILVKNYFGKEIVKSFYKEDDFERKEFSKSNDLGVPVVISKLQESATLFPRKVAVTTGDEFLSYEDLNKQSNQLAFFLREKGVKPGDIVGIYLGRSNAVIVSIMGVLKAGAAYMPIDVDVPVERVGYMLTNSNSKYFITDQPAFEKYELEERKLIYNEIIIVCKDLASCNKPTLTDLDDPMYIIYTSGSTGNPKGVTLTRKNIDYFVKEVIVDLNFCSEDVFAAITSISFDAAIFDTLIPYLFGASVHMLDSYQRKDPKQILRLFQEKNVTKTIATPTHWHLIANSGWNNKLPFLTVLSIGEPLQKSLVDIISPLSKEIFNLYGPAETTVYSTFKKINISDSQITIGTAVPGTKVYLVDKLGIPITKSGVTGEIWIGGDGVGLGYLGFKELTVEKFVSNSFDENPQNLYKTGDLGHWLENGEIQCEGRIDHQVKIRGHRIELGEIEQRILMFDEVSNAIVDTDKGKDIVNLVAYISIREHLRDRLDLNAYIDKLREKLSIGLPDYMIPTEFMFIDDFKLTTSGKIDRKQLPISLIGKKSSSDNQFKFSYFNIELTKVETSVYSLWEKVLGKRKFSLDDDFFLVGGHSLLGVTLISLLEKKFNVSFSLLTLFQHPTIRAISKLIVNEKYDINADSLVLIKKGSSDRVLCFVHGVGLNPIEVNTLLKYMDEDQTIWGLQSPAISGNVKPFETIPEMARHFIKELDEKGIQEPFHLTGNSIGGIIVFEMVKQLIAANRPLGFISMIDTPCYFSSDKHKNVSKKVVNICRKLEFEYEFFTDDVSYYLENRKGYLQEKWRNFKGISKLENSLSKRISEIEAVNVVAWKNYQIEPLEVEFTLFTAQKKTFFLNDFETLGWRKYVRKVESIVMPGNHVTMLKPPNGAKFTEVLQKKLNDHKVTIYQ